MSISFFVFVIIPSVSIVVTAVGMPFYRRSIMNCAGEKVLSLAKKKQRISYLTYVLACIVLLLTLRFNFGRLNFVIPYCAVLGFFIAVRENTFLPDNGVYENLLINGSAVIKYKDIETIDFEGFEANPTNVIKLKLFKKRPQQLTFNNSNEAHEVINILKEKVTEKN